MSRRLFLTLLALGIVKSSAGAFFVQAAEQSVQTQLDANTEQLATLQAKIDNYQKQLNGLGTEKKTLQAAINSLTLTQKKLTTQIELTQTKISSANLQIKKLTNSIGDKEASIEDDQQAIAKSLRTLAQVEETPLLAKVIASKNFSEGWKIADEFVQFNAAIEKNIADLRSARATLSANRDQVSATKKTLVSLQADLNDQKRSVNATKKTQQNLLTETKNQESTYQKLLAAAKAELASYTAFTTNAGGSKLLANQTSCDDWGCYYSQRDTIWGNTLLSGTRERLAASGCLVTAMAMVLTHYGHRTVTPVSINADSGNFSPFGGLLLYTINVDGVTATRYKTAKIDSILSSGHPAVIGVHAYGGTHFVVLTSGSNGNYLMRDPYVANGKDISLTAHYPLKSIFSIAKVVVSS